MPSVSNTKIIYGGPPNGKPVPGETLKVDNSETIDLDNVKLPENAFLAKTLSLSLDPYQRGKMSKPDPKRYTAAYEPGKVIYNFGVVEVLKSTDPKYQVGQKLYGIFPFQQYTVIDKPPLGATVGDKGGYKIIENSEGLSWTAWVGACGMPGKTADYGWKEFSKAKPGEKVFVTSAYGPVGSLVCQLAKESGCEVIASAGSDAKVEWLKKELGVKAFNYKTSDTAKELEDFGGVDIYWDGVGGETLDAALGASKNGARFIECGMISGYNSGEGTHLKNIMKIVGNNLTISGFIVSVLEDKYVDDFYKTIPKQFAEGKFKFKEHVIEGLENTPEAFLAMLNGENDGKVAIKVAN